MRWILTQCNPKKSDDSVRTTLFDTAIFKYYELTVSPTLITLSVGHKTYMNQEAMAFWRRLIVVVERSKPVSLDAELERESLGKHVLHKMRGVL